MRRTAWSVLACKYCVRVCVCVLKCCMSWADSNSMILCGVYYAAWMYLIPRWRGYRIRAEVVEAKDAAVSHRLVKVPVAEVEHWDASHDDEGRVLVGQ